MTNKKGEKKDYFIKGTLIPKEKLGILNKMTVDLWKESLEYGHDIINKIYVEYGVVEVER